MKRLALIIALCLIPQLADAANVTKTVGATGADYTTLAAAVADLDDGTDAAINTTAYGSGDVAILELIDPSYAISSLGVDGGGTVGLAGIIIRPASGNKHDGTIGTGCKLTVAALTYGVSQVTAVPLTLEDLEFHANVTSGVHSTRHLVTSSAAFGAVSNSTLTVQRCLFWCDGGERSSGEECIAIRVNHITLTGTTVNILNCVFQGFTTGSSVSGIAIAAQTGTYTINVLNCTAAGCDRAIWCTAADGTRTVKNTVAVDSTQTDWYGDENWGVASNNFSGDATFGTTTSQTLADLFEDDAAGDFTPKAGSDLIGAGADLVTTPTGVNIDAKGRDRDAMGDTWDAGAIQTYSAGGGVVYDPLGRQLNDPIEGGPVW